MNIGLIKTIFYIIITFVLFFLIVNGLREAKEAEEKEEKYSIIVSQLILFGIWYLVSFLYLN